MTSSGAAKGREFAESRAVWVVQATVARSRD